MPFQDFKLDPLTRDIYLEETGLLAVVSDAERVAQHVRTRLRTQLGEWLLDTSSGVDWLNKVFVRNPNLTIIRAMVGVQILAVADVARLRSLVLVVDAETRTLEISFIINTTFGEVSGGI